MPRKNTPILRSGYKVLSRDLKLSPKPSSVAQDWLAHHDALYVEEWHSFVIRRAGSRTYALLPHDRMAREVAVWSEDRWPSLRATKAWCNDAVWQAVNHVQSVHVIEPPTKHAAFADCTLDLYTMKPLPPDAAPTVIGFDFRLSDVMKAEGKLWDEYLRSTFVAEDGTYDPALASSFKEAAGTLLCSSRAVSCAVFLYGPTAGNGKSTFLDVMRWLLGKSLVSAMSMSSLSENRFATAHLLAKLFNFCGEVGTKYAKSDVFKSIVTGDLIPAEYKFGDSFEFVPETRLWFAVNSMPTFEGMDDGLMRRMRMYPFRATFRAGKRIDGLARRIVAEESKAVLRWMIEGARKLVDNGYAFSPEADEAIASTMTQFEAESSAVARFVADRGWHYSPNYAPCPTADVYSDYRLWCAETNCKMMNDNNFMTEFRRVTKCGRTFNEWHKAKDVRQVKDDAGGYTTKEVQVDRRLKSLRVAKVTEEKTPKLKL